MGLYQEQQPRSGDAEGSLEMRHHAGCGKSKEQRVTHVAKKTYAWMHRVSDTTRRMRPPGMHTSLRGPSLSIPPKLRWHRESAIPRVHKVPRMSTDKKVLCGVGGVFLMGVVYSVWISLQVIGCCG